MTTGQAVPVFPGEKAGRPFRTRRICVMSVTFLKAPPS